MKLLITGGLGFLGCHLAIKLAKDKHEVIVVDNLPLSDEDLYTSNLLKLTNVQILRCNLLEENLDANLFEGLDCIIHLAAILGVDNVLSNPKKTLDLNYRLLFNVLEAAKLNVDIKFIFASTSEVYAQSVEEGIATIPTPEETNIILPELRNARTTYMISKLYGECLTHNSNVSPIIIRPHNLYGPRMGMRHVIPQLIDRIRSTPKGGSLDVYSPEHTRTFCFIEDAVKQISSLVYKEDLNKSVFNIGTEAPEIKIFELAEMLASMMYREDIHLVKAGITQGSPSRRCPDTKRIDQIMDDTHRVSLEEGLKATLSYYTKS